MVIEWKIPDQPEGVTHVVDRRGEPWFLLQGSVWRHYDTLTDIQWWELVAKRGPLRPAPEPPIEVPSEKLTVEAVEESLRNHVLDKGHFNSRRDVARTIVKFLKGDAVD